MTQIRKTLDDIVLDRRAGIGVTQDEMFVANSLPFDLLPGTEGMPLRENHEYLLGPQLQHFAIWHSRGAHDESDIEPSLPNEREMLARRNLGNL